MNDIAQEVLKRADKIDAWLGGVVDKTADVATQQAIDIAMQYLAFGRIYHTSAVLISIALTAVIIWLSVKFSKQSDGMSLFYNVFLVAPMVIFIDNFKDMILVWSAPKVWLITQLTALAKGQ